MSTPAKVKTVCVPLDPDDCGSVISGYVRYPEINKETYGRKKEQYLDFGANLSLSDCSRVIGWNFSRNEEFNLDKIDRVICALLDYRTYLEEAEEQRKILKVEVEAYNKDLKEDEPQSP